MTSHNISRPTGVAASQERVSQLSNVPDSSLPFVPDDVRGEGVLDVHVEPQEILFGVGVEVVVELRRRGDFPPVKEGAQDSCT